jgi:putative N6-adenine-specific DNA methylase
MAENILNLFAATAPGCEPLVADELAGLGLPAEAVVGGVDFAGTMDDVYRANLHLRCANRVLVRFAHFRATAFPDLYRRCVRLPWGRFIKPAAAVEVRGRCRHSRLMHTDRIAETVRQGIDRALGRSEPPPSQDFAQQVLVRFSEDQCQISIDSSGDLLHRRGYRQEQGAAPLRETLAAALLHASGWDGAEPLWDPMCGSGTLLIEGALLASRAAPGLQRHFAFENWPRFRPGRWQVLRQQAEKNRVPISSDLLFGTDHAADVLDGAQRNAQRAGVANLIAWRHGDFRDFAPPAQKGVILCNPPYGERLEDKKAVRSLYADFGTYVREHAHGWRGGFVCPDPALAAATGLPLTPAIDFPNGGLRVRLYLFNPQ